MYSDELDDLETLSQSASETKSDSTECHVEQKSTSGRSASSAKPTKRKCPPREQMFKDNWLQISEFKNWLSKRTAQIGSPVL